MKKIASSSLCLFFGLGGLLLSQTKPDGQRAYDHIRYLASDEMKGRRAGSPEYQKAAEYVAAKMKEYGLTPGGDNGTWFQEVPFRNWSDYQQPIRLEILTPQRRVYFAGRGRDFYPLSGTGSGISKGQIAFAGYGVVSENPPWNDYENLEAKGKILLLLPEAPAVLDDAAKREWTLEKKVKLALEKGAVGIIEMDTSQPGDQPMRRMVSAVLRPGVCPKNFVLLRAGRSFLNDVFYVSRKSWRHRRPARQ